jgi:hypothetical protein
MQYKTPKNYSDLIGSDWINFLINSDRYLTQAKIHKTFLEKFMGVSELKHYQDYLLWQLKKLEISENRYRKLEKIYSLTDSQKNIIDDKLKFSTFAIDDYLAVIADYSQSDSILKNFVGCLLASGLTPFNIIFSHFIKFDKYTIEIDDYRLNLLIDFDLFNDIHLLLLDDNKGLTKQDIDNKYRNNLLKYLKEINIKGLTKLLDISPFYLHSVHKLNTPFLLCPNLIDSKQYALKKYISITCT